MICIDFLLFKTAEAPGNHLHLFQWCLEKCKQWLNVQNIKLVDVPSKMHCTVVRLHPYSLTFLVALYSNNIFLEFLPFQIDFQLKMEKIIVLDKKSWKKPMKIPDNCFTLISTLQQRNLNKYFDNRYNLASRHFKITNDMSRHILPEYWRTRIKRFLNQGTSRRANHWFHGNIMATKG